MTGEKRVGLFFLGVLMLFWAALAAVSVWPFRLESYVANLLVYLAAWFVMASAQTLAGLARYRPDRPLAWLLDGPLGPDFRRRVWESWPILVVSILFMPGFSAMKSAIPLFQPYSWDQRFIDLDIAIHGQDPWRLLQPLLGYPIVTSAISIFYHLWVLLIYMGTIYFALFVDDRSLRIRYFAACFGLWAINGVALAILFASVGPCFVGPLLGNPHFAEQAAYLAQANQQWPVMVVEVQQQLIAWHQSGSHGLGRGITAMPSMHVALALLFFLAVRQVGRRLGLTFFAFFAIIVIGSVHLGYHYAVDAYVSIAVTAALWGLCGALVRRRTRPEPAVGAASIA